MRTRVVLGFALGLVLIKFPARLNAQFQEPSKEELQMTSYASAPGAAAVYLYREETTDDNLHFHSYYVRAKILTEKGKELATVHVPYRHGEFKVRDIRGRTIHADGSVIPLTMKPSDLMDFKTKDLQVNTVVFTLPSVEVGSILEYRLELQYDDNMVSSPDWQVQQEYPVVKAHYMFMPSSHGGWITNSRGEALSRLMWAVSPANAVAKVVDDNRGRYTFDVTDVPAIPNDDWMPPLNSLNWRVEFYYTQYVSGGEFWQKEGKRWLKEADRFANPSNELHQAVSGIVAAGDTDEQKARKIYAAVMKLDNTNFTREKSVAERKNENLKEIKDATDVWKQQSGSANDLALLYVAMARAAGLQAYPMEVVDRNRAIFDPLRLSTDQLDDYLAIVTIGGKEVYLDPGQKYCSFGLLHWKHTLAGGLRGSANGPEYGQTAAGAYKENGVSRVADLAIDSDGSVKGSLRFVMSGQEALHWRQLALENDTEEVKKQFNESMRAYVPDGVEADFDHFLGLDNYDANLIGIVKVSGNMGAATGKRFFLPGLFFESRAKHPFVAEEKRLIPVDVHYAKMELDEVIFHLPEGYTVESAPQLTNLSWPDRAVLKIDAKPNGNTLSVTRTLAYNYTLLDPKEYGDLRNFYQKVATADQQQLVLMRGPVVAAKGN